MSELTAEAITDWLNDPDAIRGTIVEVKVLPLGSTTEITRYLSTFNYTTGASDIPSNTYYEPIIVGGLKYTENLDLAGTANISIGDIELKNTTGEFDSWLDDIWVNRSIKAYIGDPRWPRDSFFLIFDGVVADIDSRNRDSLNIKIRDKLQRLSTPIMELKYSDIGMPYPDSSNLTAIRDPLDPSNVTPDLDLPVTFGEVHNITPVLIDAGNLVYITHFGPIKGIIEIRDNGLPLTENTYTVDVTKGTFKMLFQPAGTLTASVKGDNTAQDWDTFATGVHYRHTAGSIIRRLVTGYGKTIPNPTTGSATLLPSPDRFSEEEDIDTDNFNAFELEEVNQQPVGFYSASRDSLLTTCQLLASSIGAQLSMSRLGKLRMLRISSPPLGTPIIITENEIIANSLQISNKTEVQGSIKLGFTKNWTVQSGLLTNIPYEHKQLFAQEYSTIIMTDTDTATAYKLTSYPAQQDTLLLNQPMATEEATRRLNMYKVPHITYRFTGVSSLLDLKLGDTVRLVHSRFGLDGTGENGLGTVTSLQPDWLTAKITVEVFV